MEWLLILLVHVMEAAQTTRLLKSISETHSYLRDVLEHGVSRVELMSWVMCHIDD